jgi:hypothetical protein
MQGHVQTTIIERVPRLRSCFLRHERDWTMYWLLPLLNDPRFNGEHFLYLKPDN